MRASTRLLFTALLVSCSSAPNGKQAPEVPDAPLDSGADDVVGPEPSWSRSTTVPPEPTSEPEAPAPVASSSAQAVVEAVPAARAAVVELAAGHKLDGDVSDWGSIPASGAFLRVAFGRDGAVLAGRVKAGSTSLEVELGFDPPPEPPVGVVLAQGFFPMTAEGCASQLGSIQGQPAPVPGAAPKRPPEPPKKAPPEAPKKRVPPLTEKACREQIASQLGTLSPLLSRFVARYGVSKGGVELRTSGGARAIQGAKAALVESASGTTFEAFVPIDSLPLRSPSPRTVALALSSESQEIETTRIARPTDLGYAPVVTAGLASYFETLESGELTQLYAVALGRDRDRVDLVTAPYRPNQAAPLKSAVRSFVVERKGVIAEEGALRVVLVSTNGLPVVAIERDGRVVAADIGNAATLTPKPGLSYEVLGHTARPQGIDVLVKVAYQLPWNAKAESVELLVLRAKRDFTLEQLATTSSSSAWTRGSVKLVVEPDLSTIRATGTSAEDASKELSAILRYDREADRYAAP